MGMGSEDSILFKPKLAYRSDGDVTPNPEDNASFGSRMNFLLRHHAGGDIGVFCEILSVASTTLRAWLKDDSEPQMSKLKSITEICKVQLDWLILGTGPVFTHHISIPVLPLNEAGRAIQQGDDLSFDKGFDRSLFDSVSIQPDDLHARFKMATDDAVIAMYQGFTMASSINHEDLVLINRSDRTVTSGIYLYAQPSFDENSGREFIYDIRRMERYPDGRLSISADNEKYGRFVWSKSELDKLELYILGKVVCKFNIFPL